MEQIYLPGRIVEMNLTKSKPAVDEIPDDTGSEISSTLVGSTAETQSDHTSTCEQDSTEPLTTWKIATRNKTSQRYFDISCEGSPLLWTETPRRSHDQRPRVILNKRGHAHPVAIAEIPRSTTARSFEFLAENTRLWRTVEVHGFTDSWFAFDFGGQTYQWKRTHKKELGASRWKQRCMKLVEGARGPTLPHAARKEGDVLMAYIQTRSVIKGKLHDIADVKFYEESMTDELKHVALVIALGIIERDREGRRHALRQISRTGPSSF